jgi:hypothetical protein
MSQKTEQFKEFIKEHPGLKKLVYGESKTWQSLFEEWILYGNSDVWEKYKDKDVKIEKEDIDINKIPISKEAAQVGDILKTCINYAKKINPDTISKTVTNVQKIMSIVAGLGAASTAKAATNNKMTGDPLFDRKFDEWY